MRDCHLQVFRHANFWCIKTRRLVACHSHHCDNLKYDVTGHTSRFDCNKNLNCVHWTSVTAVRITANYSRWYYMVHITVRVIKSRRMRWAGHVARMGEESGVYRVLVGKPEGKRPLGRPRRRWVDNIRMDLQEVGCGYMDWIGLAQDRETWRTLVSAVMNLRVPWNEGNFLTSCKPVSFSRRTLHHGVSKWVCIAGNLLNREWVNACAFYIFSKFKFQVHAKNMKMTREGFPYFLKQNRGLFQ